MSEDFMGWDYDMNLVNGQRVESLHWTVKPKKPGKFEVKWHGWNTAFPVYMEWDGFQWVDLEKKRGCYPVVLSPQHAKLNITSPGDFFWHPRDRSDVEDTFAVGDIVQGYSGRPRIEDGVTNI